MNIACIKFNKVISPQKHVYVYKYTLHLQKDKMSLEFEIGVLGPVHMHKIYTCKYFAIWSKYTHISKSIFNLRSHAYSVHISILKVTLDQLYFDSSHVQTVR